MNNSIWDDAIDIGLQGANMVRERLKIDEEKYSKYKIFSDIPFRDFFLFTILDEIQKASTSLIRWDEFFSGGTPSGMNEIQSQIYRITLQATYEEQSLRNRKLIELIVDILLFIEINEDIYFEDYIYIHQLCEIENEKKDIKEFYGLNHDSYQEIINGLYEKIESIEKKGIDPGKRWYLSEKKNLKNIKNVRLSSFRQKFIKLSERNCSDMVSVLGFSYNQVYSESKYLHFNPDLISNDFKSIAWLKNGNKTAFLIINAIQSIERLLDTEIIENIKDGYPTIVKDNNEKIFRETILKRIEIDDYVIANGELGKVVDIVTSKYKLKSYKVKMIDGISFDNFIENWYMPQRLQVLGNRKAIVGDILRIINDIEENNLTSIEEINEKVNEKKFEILLFQSYKELLKVYKEKNKI